MANPIPPYRYDAAMVEEGSIDEQPVDATQRYCRLDKLIYAGQTDRQTDG